MNAPAPTEHVVLPDGSCLHYRDTQHAYLSCSGDPDHRSCNPRLPGVSTIAKALDLDPSALVRASARKDHEGIAILLSDVLSLEEGEDVRLALMPLCSADGLSHRLDSEELTYRHQWDKLATAGTLIHDRVFHCLARGDTPDLGGMSDRERGLAEAAMGWWKHREPQVLNAEQVVMHPTLNYAGRFDLRARITVSDPDEALSLGVPLDEPFIATIDLKTGSGFVATAYHAQLRGYIEAAKACGVGGSDHGFVLTAKDDGTWKEHPCLADSTDFYNCISTYRSSTRIKRELDRQFRASKRAAA